MKAKSTSSRRGRPAKPSQGETLRLRRSIEEIEFLEAMERYQRGNRRPHPTWSEVLEVVRALGYRKRPQPRGADPDSKRWQQLCNDLREERDRLQLEVAKVKAERDQYLRIVYDLTWEEIEVPDKKTVFAQLGKGKPLEEFIAELEAQGAG